MLYILPLRRITTFNSYSRIYGETLDIFPACGFQETKWKDLQYRIFIIERKLKTYKITYQWSYINSKINNVIIRMQYLNVQKQIRMKQGLTMFIYLICGQLEIFIGTKSQEPGGQFNHYEFITCLVL